jgi:hypothetical protein
VERKVDCDEIKGVEIERSDGGTAHCKDSASEKEDGDGLGVQALLNLGFDCANGHIGREGEREEGGLHRAEGNWDHSGERRSKYVI